MRARGVLRPPSGLGGKLALTLIVLSVLGTMTAAATWSAFSATTSNASNSFSAGTVSLTDNDSGSAMLALSTAKPGDTDTSCIKVTYTGNLSSTVRLYGTTTGTGLDAYLDLVVTRGTYTPSEPSFDSCTNFSADSTNYIGAGNGVIYSGTLQAWADDYTTGLVDPYATSPETWTNNEVHVYKFTVTLQNNNSAQGLNATQTFTWESRNQ